MRGRFAREPKSGTELKNNVILKSDVGAIRELNAADEYHVSECEDTLLGSRKAVNGIYKIVSSLKRSRCNQGAEYSRWISCFGMRGHFAREPKSGERNYKTVSSLKRSRCNQGSEYSGWVSCFGMRGCFAREPKSRTELKNNVILKSDVGAQFRIS